MKSYGCVVCRAETSDPNERFIIPWTHEMYCEKHKPEGSIALSEFYAYGGSWFKWNKVKVAASAVLKAQKTGESEVA